MKPISNTRRLKVLGASTVALAMLGSAAMAQETRLGTVKVQADAIDSNPNATPGVPYKAKTSGDDRHTRPIAETPATIQITHPHRPFGASRSSTASCGSTGL